MSHDFDLLNFCLLSLAKQVNELSEKIDTLDYLIKFAPDMIYWKDQHSVHLGCNDIFATAAGYSDRHSIIGKTDYDFPWRNRAAKYINDDKDVLLTGKPKVNIEDLVTTANGKEITVISNKVPLKNSKGNVIGILGIATDVTTLKNAEMELLKAKSLKEEFYMINNIIKYAPDMIYWKDKNSVHLGCNDQFAIAAGYSNRDEIIGKTDYDFPWHDQAEKYILDDSEVIKSGQPRLNIEDVMPFNNGKKAIVITNKVPLRNSKGEVVGVLGIATDITHQKKIESDLKKAKEAAEVANIAKTEFIANMSHDIRTPLAGVVGLGEILEKRIQDKEQKHLTHDLVQSANQLLNMLNEILDVISADNINTNDIHEEPFDLYQLVQNIIDLEQSSVDFKKIQLLSQVDNNIPPILISDHKKIHHILLNLIGNAIKFTNQGNVTIKVDLLEKQPDKVTLDFAIIDTGKGIPPEALSKVFDAFYRVTPSYKGLDKGHGLGLHIAQNYTKLLGGHIAVASKLDEGSKFSFSLTMRIADADAVPKNVTQDSLQQRSEEPPVYTLSLSSVPMVDLANAPEVLIIEDNAVACTIAKTLLIDAHCNPTTASTGQAGLEMAKNHDFDLIISDVGLPDISGLEVTRQLRSYEKAHGKTPVPIVGLTAHAGGIMHTDCREAGMDEVLIKPIKAESLQNICSQFSLFADTQHVAPSQPNPPAAPVEKQGALGEDLPDTESELFSLTEFPICDRDKALKILGNNAGLLKELVNTTIHTLIPEELALLEQAHTAENWQTVARIAHKLKGGFLSIGLTKAAIACQYLERYFKAGHTKLLEKLYTQMLEVLQETSIDLKNFA